MTLGVTVSSQKKKCLIKNSLYYGRLKKEVIIVKIIEHGYRMVNTVV